MFLKRVSEELKQQVIRIIDKEIEELIKEIEDLNMKCFENQKRIKELKEARKELVQEEEGSLYV